jgi:Concanavalin A-like lectin/glucanases superfamily
MRRLTIGLLALAVLATSAGAAVAAFLASTSNTGNTVSAASSFTACDYPGAIQGTSGLMSYWRLGETSGTTAADSKGTNNGTYTGGVTLGASDAIAGDSNTAASFDGTDDYVATPLAPFVNGGTITVEAWAKRTNTSTADVIWAGATESSQPILRFNASTNDIGFWPNASTTNVTWAGAASAGAWHHIVLVFNEATDTAELFVNGASKGTRTASVAYTSPGNFKVGSRGPAAADVFLGVIDEVGVYNRALTAAEVQNHFRCGQRYRDVVMDTSGLQSYWRLGEPLGGVAFDTKGPSNGSYTGPPDLGQTGALTAPGDLAPSFDSVNDWADFGDVYDFTGTSQFSVEAWINRGTLRETSFRWIVGKDTTNASREGWNLNLESNTHTVRFERWSNNTMNMTESTTATVAGTWYHVVGTYDGATMRIYLNGVQQGSLASTQSQANTAFPLRVGAIGATGGGKFHGNIDEVAVYNTALTAAQVDQHYDAR